MSLGAMSYLELSSARSKAADRMGEFSGRPHGLGLSAARGRRGNLLRGSNAQDRRLHETGAKPFCRVFHCNQHVPAFARNQDDPDWNGLRGLGRHWRNRNRRLRYHPPGRRPESVADVLLLADLGGHCRIETRIAVSEVSLNAFIKAFPRHHLRISCGEVRRGLNKGVAVILRSKSAENPA